MMMMMMRRRTLPAVALVERHYVKPRALLLLSRPLVSVLAHAELLLTLADVTQVWCLGHRVVVAACSVLVVVHTSGSVVNYSVHWRCSLEVALSEPGQGSPPHFCEG